MIGNIAPIIRDAALIFSSFIPRTLTKNYAKRWLKYAGSKDDERVWAGSRLILALLFGFIGFLLPETIFPIIDSIYGTNFHQTVFGGETLIFMQLGLFAIFFVAVLVLSYLHIAYAIDGRKKMVENALPDFLMLVASNLKSGMTPFSAFRAAVRPEFGPLSEEIKVATQKSLGVESFSQALKHIADRVDSDILRETSKFFAQALVSGGHLSELIESSAKDIKQTEKLKQELVTSTRMYTIFIVFVVVVASPMLLAVSVQFLTIMSSIQNQAGGLSQVSGEVTAQIGFSSGKITIEPDFMRTIAFALLTCNSVLASVFIGIVGGDKIISGLKYSPFLFIGSIGLFIIMTNIVSSLLGAFV
ncbi:MAG: type II secretion system F family protein [Candidatus Diapherotrites archaeon]|nr:type II secretion system F family protein [Candidatus Diapherotrites archaeon]